MHQTNGANLALDITENNDILGQNCGLYAAFRANSKTGSLQSNYTLNLSVDEQVLCAGELSAYLRQGSNYSGTFTWLHKILAAPGQLERSKRASGCQADYTQQRRGNTIDHTAASFV